MLNETHLGKDKVSIQEVEKMKQFYEETARALATAEANGTYVVADCKVTFPKVNNKLYEPEGQNWMKPPVYAESTMDVW